LLWGGLAVALVAVAVAGYVWFLSTPVDPVATAERIDLCEAITLAALDKPPAYQRLNAFDMRQLVVVRIVVIVFRTSDAPRAAFDGASCLFATPFRSSYGRPGMIRATVSGRPVDQRLVDSVAARWAAGRS